MSNFYSLITSLSLHQMKQFWNSFVEFKGLPNRANFILIDHCIGELLSINKVWSEQKCTVAFVSLCKLASWKEMTCKIVYTTRWMHGTVGQV